MQLCPVDGPLTLRLSAEPGRHSKIQLEYENGGKWILFREVIGWLFDKAENVDIGVMACSPGNGCFRAEFWDIIAQDYSEFAYERLMEDGTLNPIYDPRTLVGP